ncbi:polysaccharide biosynthesis tyrosine autokinase [Cellulomonas sp. JH27-2]|uniref:polysaccharide biosynthesis tyrosine autokinase n=1 Tax=Cellulomonas sp. JH27-2 TaxID=2774139 RepID=UPI001782D062|nr:polysaccharide biosynthesis tyrosine autokinase [Cellulomonas sp. JH27-2]MBD8059607.1 polysaccharide biosynthesis tyrosine autokinase [Cellulomonas sp. JH27-2]
MELKDFVVALRKRWFIIVVLALVGAGWGYHQVSQVTPTYRSTSKVFVSLTRGDTVAELVQGSTYTQNLVASFAQLATMPVVLDPVIDELGLDTNAKSLAGVVQADALLDVVIIEISASSTDPQQAADIANAVAAQLSKTVRQVTPTTTNGGPSVNMTIVSQAAPARFPYSPKKKVGIAKPALIGVALGAAIALLASRLDTRLRSAKDFPGQPERPVLGQIAYDRRLRKLGPRAILANRHGGLAEAYRRLRTNIQFVNASAPVSTVLVTSSVPGEGKSTTAISLALTMAEKRKRVLLVDADLRRPSVARLCGLEGAVGLSTILVGEATIEDVAHPWGLDSLAVVPAGAIPPNPSQLVDSEAMEKFLVTARSQYDFVIIDTPPVLSLTDAAVLAKRTDGAIVVAGCRKVRRAQLVETLNALDAIGVNVIGLVANGVRQRGHDRLYGYGEPRLRDRIFRRHRRGTRSGETSVAVQTSLADAGDTPDGIDELAVAATTESRATDLRLPAPRESASEKTSPDEQDALDDDPESKDVDKSPAHAAAGDGGRTDSGGEG